MGENITDWWSFYDRVLESDERLFREEPLLDSVFDLKNSETLVLAERYAKSATVDEFLKEKFDGIGIVEFMKIYSKLHINVEIAIPIPENMVVFFRTEYKADMLSQKLWDYQAPVIDVSGGTKLNLHTDNFYELTLIRAVFDLDKERSKFNGGYFYETENWLFYIRSSIQMDLTILYKEKMEAGE